MTDTDSIAQLPIELQEKYTRLVSLFTEMKSVIVGYSGGVDSGLLSLVAYQTLGDSMLAVTIASPIEAESEVENAVKCAEVVGFPLRKFIINDLENKDFVANSPERCYFCKFNRFKLIKQIMDKEGYRVAVEGTNADDSSEYRPGRRAVLELAIRSPLAEVGLTKKEIRQLAKALGLPTWQKPSAPCLATRFPYGTPITYEGLRMIEAAERYLSGLGFQSIRVRCAGVSARIEVAPEQISRLVESRLEISRHLKGLGYKYISVDLDGYRSGSMDEVIEK